MVSAMKRMALWCLSRVWKLLPDRAIYQAIGWWYPRRREPEIRLVDQMMPAGGVAIDIGVWYGPWTKALARRASVVHAFEPQPDLCRFLRKVCEPNVVVHQLALSDVSGVTELWTDEGAPALNSLGSVEHSEGSMTVISVRTAPLDASHLCDVALLKIDVEGHEAAVLRGATATIDRERPRIVIEIEQRHLNCPIFDIFDQIRAHGYRGYALRIGVPEPLETFSLQGDQLAWVEHLPAREYVNNFLFLPDEDPWTPSSPDKQAA